MIRISTECPADFRARRVGTCSHLRFLTLPLALVMALLAGSRADAWEPPNLYWSDYGYWWAVTNEREFKISESFGSGRLSVQVEGGDGGNSRAKYGTFAGTITAFGVGGPGAKVTANFSVGDGPDQIPPGSHIRFIIGSKGASGNETIVPGIGSVPASESGNGTGGNGGSASSAWVKPPGQSNYQLLVAAGGGGGAYSNVLSLVPVSGDGRYGRYSGDGYGPTANGGEGAGVSSGDGGTNGGKGEESGLSSDTKGGWGMSKYWNGRYSSWLGGGGSAGGNSQGGGGGGYSGGGAGGEAGGGGGGGSYYNPDFRSANQTIWPRANRRESRLPQDGAASYSLVRGYGVTPRSIYTDDSSKYQPIRVRAYASPVDPWTATTSASWLHLTHASGQGSTNTGFTIDANTGPTRWGSISIAGQNIYVQQGGTEIVTSDSDYFASGSLRSAVYYAGPGSTIVFDSSLSGATIDLLAELIFDKDLTIDASALPEGITIDASGGSTLHRAMTIEEGMTVTLKNITITGGDATTSGTFHLGGAILNYGALTLDGCTITGNTADYGGGIYSATDLGINSLTITDSTISGNSSNLDGGGIYARGSHVQIDQCVFTANSASRSGGGYFKASYPGSSSTMTNCNLVSNSADVSGGGVVGSAVNNSIVYFNTAPADPNHTGCTFHHSCSSPAPGGAGNIGGDPQFMAMDDFRLQPTSPCIDTGDNSHVETIPTDLAGNPRIADGPVDMGVFEEQGPAIYYVSPSGDDDADGFSWETAKQTIQAAVDTVAVGSTIMVGDGVYETGGRIVHGSLPNRVAIDKAITVRSLNGPDFTTIRGALDPLDTVGDGAIRCVYLGAGAELAGFTLTNGATRAAGDIHAEQSGGGIWCESEALVLDCTITGNVATIYGGGSVGGNLLNCRLTNNLAEPRELFDESNGGGAWGGKLTNCVLSGNVADNGGGAYNSQLERCTVTGNRALGYGGGVRSGTVRDCTLSGNVAENQDGGGAYQSELHNCVLTSNEANNGGGASDSTLNNCTVTGCNAENSGGGAHGGTLNNCTLKGNHSINGPGGVSDATLNNCIVYFNTSDEDPAGGTYNHSASFFNHSCSLPLPPGTGNIDDDPEFVNKDTNDLRLERSVLVTSPCIDTGDNSSAPYESVDLDGNARIVHCSVDMGAYENQESAATWYVSTGGDDLADGSSWATAKETIQAAIDAAAACDTVMVDDGVYAVGTRVVAGHGLANRVVIDKALTVRSVNGPEVTTIEGLGPIGPSAVRCVYLGANATLSGFTLANGATLASQVGSYFFEAAGAGGAFCEAGAVMENCIVSGNSGVSPGGVFGGTLNNCLVVNNHATHWGGGARGSTMNNSILDGNSAGLDGGGVWDGSLNNCTLADNSAGVKGGGAVLGLLTNCIVQDNTAPANPNHTPDCTFAYSCSSPLPAGPDNIDDAPEFANPTAGDYRLRSSSPCIDAGDNAGALFATDFDGNPRVVNGRTDMGALESNGGYAVWASAITNGLIGYSDSAAGDGVPNIVKYATGSSATVADPQSALSLLNKTGPLQLSFNRSRNALDVTIEVEASNELSGAPWEVLSTWQFGSWTPANVITENGDGSSVTVCVDDPVAGPVRRFYRLRVTGP